MSTSGPLPAAAPPGPACRIGAESPSRRGAILSEIVLASSSPRRQELLSMVTPRFRVVPPSSVDESAAQGCARDVVCRLALEKAVEVLARLEREAPSAGRIVLGADTLVAVPLSEGERILGKP
ncbi:MAG TPA: Maf family protein, partial [Planctomycetota bacterium]|nr:Maf family protein [Planctomycetota bacterium]